MTENTPDAVKVAPVDIYRAINARVNEAGDLPRDAITAVCRDIAAILGARAMQAAMPAPAGVREDYAAICKELGCIEKPGVPLRFIQEMRKNLAAAGERIDWLLRSWDDATITERQELDRMRRGWGPTTPTERMLRERDLRDCMQALSIALTDLTTPEDDNADPEVEARLQEAYDRVNKQYLVSLEILRRLDEPQPRPDLEPAIEAAGAREGAEDQQPSGAGLEDDISPVEAMAMACGMLPPAVNLHDAYARERAAKDVPPAPTPAGAGDLVKRLLYELKQTDEDSRVYGVLSDAVDSVVASASRIEALEAEVVPESLRGQTFAVQHNPNCPSPWLVRLPGKSGVIDLKPYGGWMVKHETGDRLGFGRTFNDAALAALVPAKAGG